jgi:spore germination protein PE
MSRWSIVGEMKINSVSQASILQIGDNNFIKPVSKALAVQRQVSEFKGNEGDFDDYAIFSREIPLPPVHNESVQMSIDNTCSRIQVGGVFLYAVTASSVFQVGTNCRIEAETRIKHIRHFINEASAESP